MMIRISIWQRKFNLEVIYDCYPGEEVLPEQVKAFELLENNPDMFDSAKKEVEEYCLSNDRKEIGKDFKENFFRYVMPKSIYITRDGIIALMCSYRLDPEHGIAVLFRNGKVLEVGSQDCVL